MLLQSRCCKAIKKTEKNSYNREVNKVMFVPSEMGKICHIQIILHLTNDHNNDN